ncbi:protein-export chaperone SecB [Pikeienuella piscinae]|uniref:Protein-export protein SecB n=1 Tax=Pikeienuella piscinae TaxID=2748098 RepID=A0A7L5C323_9RHOB|nr:protein-export chaperone SecB [Pikeienuella piscinae]QIE56299.1 protein-export chaperone SecB [Pikeienuella piscinae]
MAEAEPTAAQGPRVAIKAQYVRDASFENVAVQKGDGRMDRKPEIQVGVNLDAKKRGENAYEVILKVNATAKHEDDVLFIVEVEYAGLFEIANVPDAQLHPFLLVECPRLLFPFTRRIVADLTRDGGYPPLMLDMVDFANLYRSEVERRKSAAQGLAGATAGSA